MHSRLEILTFINVKQYEASALSIVQVQRHIRSTITTNVYIDSNQCQRLSDNTVKYHSRIT